MDVTKSTVNSVESKFDAFYAKFNRFYEIVIPWMLAVLIVVTSLLLLKELL